MAGTNEFQKLEHSAVKLTIKLTKDEVRTEYDKNLKNLLKDLQIPGFRRGKVPASVLERKAGPSLKEDILNQIIATNVNDLLKSDSVADENQPLAYSEPQVDGEPKLDLDSDLSFSVIYDVLPQVKLEKWEGFEAEVDEAEVTDEDIARELEKIRERNAIVMERDDSAAAQSGDVVTADYCELNDDGSVIAGTQREDFVWELGKGYNLFKIDDEVTGMKKNETKDFTKTYPEDFADKELAGKTKKLRVKVKLIKEKKLPELDDDLAQDVDEKFKTLDDLKKNTREKLESRLADGLKAMRQDAIVQKVIEANPIDLPESMVRYELGNNIRRMFGGYEMTNEQIDRFIDGNTNFTEMWRPQIEKKLKGSLLVNELIKQQNFAITDDDREKEIADYAERVGASVEDIKKAFPDPETSPIDSMIKERKAFELLADKNTVKKGKTVKYLDLFPDNA